MTYVIHFTALTYLLTYSMVESPWKLTGLQLVKKFPAFHGTRRFITALTSVRHLSLSWASPIQSIYPHPTSWRSILLLSTHLRLGLPSGLFPSGFPTRPYTLPSPHPYAPHAQPISFFSILSPAQYWARSANHLAPRYAISSKLPIKFVIVASSWLFILLYQRCTVTQTSNSSPCLFVFAMHAHSATQVGDIRHTVSIFKVQTVPERQAVPKLC